MERGEGKPDLKMEAMQIHKSPWEMYKPEEAKASFQEGFWGLNPECGEEDEVGTKEGMRLS